MGKMSKIAPKTGREAQKKRTGDRETEKPGLGAVGPKSARSCKTGSSCKPANARPDIYGSLPILGTTQIGSGWIQWAATGGVRQRVFGRPGRSASGREATHKSEQGCKNRKSNCMRRTVSI